MRFICVRPSQPKVVRRTAHQCRPETRARPERQVQPLARPHPVGFGGESCVALPFLATWAAGARSRPRIVTRCYIARAISSSS